MNQYLNEYQIPIKKQKYSKASNFKIKNVLNKFPDFRTELLNLMEKKVNHFVAIKKTNENIIEKHQTNVEL